MQQGDLVPDDDLSGDLEEVRKLWLQVETLKQSLKMKSDKVGARMGLSRANVVKLVELQTHFRESPTHEMTLELRYFLDDEAA